MEKAECSGDEPKRKLVKISPSSNQSNSFIQEENSDSRLKNELSENKNESSKNRNVSSENSDLSVKKELSETKSESSGSRNVSSENSDLSVKKELSETKSESSGSRNVSLGKSNNSGKNESGDDENDKSTEFSSLVAAHYNSVQTNLDTRSSSRIYYLRNFNNWVKSLCIKESVWELEGYDSRNLKVLDMCCGKGGDLFKWSKLNVRYMVCADIAELSLEEYKIRYSDYIEKCQRNEKFCNLECEFILADCTRMRLRGKYMDPSIQFDVVSCQFSFHYCFESLPQAECMLKNVSECLRPGGVFIGTIPNANEIIKRLKQSKSNSLKNEVFAVEMCCTEPYPLFGAKYNFYLEDVVNCPEFLVHFPTFEKLALKFGLKLVRKEKFTDFFERRRRTREGEITLRRLKAMETYTTSVGGRKLIGPYKDYMHARVYCEMNSVSQVGTLSQSEWDVISLYQTFVFKKVKSL